MTIQDLPAGIKEAQRYYRKVMLSPDFIAARRDGKLIYHEHAGLMSEGSYAAAFQNKLRSYAACGIVPWDNLIISYDGPGGRLDLKLIEAEMESKGLIFN